MRIRAAMFAAFVLAAGAANAHGDGAFVWRKGADLNEPSQKAILHWHGGTEVMVLQVKYEGPAEDFAWIVPLPARPQVTAVKAEKTPFAEISLYTQRRARWGYRGKGRDGAKGRPEVKVLERKIVGVYDVAVLAATDPTALSEWLNKNGYAFPEKRSDVLKHYTKKRWVYVAMRIDRKALSSEKARKLKTGELQPIRFRFATKEMVYPLRISSINAGKTEVLLYVLAETPMVLKGDHKQPGLSIESNIPRLPTEWSTDPTYGTYRKATAKELPLTWEALGLAKDTTWSLCKYRAVCETREMTDDLAFARFDPLTHLKKRLEGREDWARRMRLLTFLVEHDKQKYEKPLHALLEEMAASKDKWARMAAARHGGAPPALLERLSKDDDRDVRRALVYNPKTPQRLLRRMARDKDAGVRNYVARNPRTPVTVLAALAKDKAIDVRRGVARNPKVPPNILIALGTDPSEHVRAAVAGNVKTTGELLAKLAGDRRLHIRRFVAASPVTPAAALAALARDPDTRVRLSLSVSPWTPSALLKQLLTDTSKEVAEQARRNLRLRDPRSGAQKITKIRIKVWPPDGMAECQWTPDGTVEGGHASGGPAVRIYTDTKKISPQKVKQIWQAAESLPRTAFAPDAVLRREKSKGIVHVLLLFEGGSAARLSWPFRGQHAEPKVRALSKLLHENRTGGW